MRTVVPEVCPEMVPMSVVGAERSGIERLLTVRVLRLDESDVGLID
jgi:hypothetical protein